MSGSKKLNLMLLPGLDGTGILFRPLIEKLKNNFHIIVLTYPTDRPSSISEMVAMVKEKLNSPEDTILLAESFSGLAALTLIDQYPIPLRGVIFCAAFTESPYLFLLKVITMMPATLLRFSWIPGIFLSIVLSGIVCESPSG